MRADANRTFTLVEMLVVIAVIGILASLLMPALGRALASGRSMVCTGNLRNFGVAFSQYADNGNGRYPFCIDSSNVTWAAQLCPYLGEIWNFNIERSTGALGVFNCPQNSVQRYQCNNNARSEVATSYGFNAYYRQEIYETNPTYYNNPGGQNARQFTYPSELRVLTDNQFFGLEYGALSGIGDGNNCVPVNYDIGPRNMRYAHNGGANMLYADGHAGFLSGPLDDRGGFQGIVNGVYKYANGRMWRSIYPF